MRGEKSDQKRVTSSVGSLQNIGLAKMFHQVFETCYRKPWTDVLANSVSKYIRRIQMENYF